MNITKLYILSIIFLCLTACTEEQIETFQAERGINFVSYNSYNKEFTDNYQKLSTDINFFTKYADKTAWDIQPDTIYIGLQIEGKIPENEVKVKLKLENVEGYTPADIDIPQEVVFAKGQYQIPVQVICKKPTTYDKLYKSQIVVDYNNSDVVAGTKERQKYIVTVSDSTDWNAISVKDEADFNNVYGKYLGNYGPIKTRFLFVSLGKASSVGGTYSVLCQQLFYYTKMGWGGVANTSIQQIIKTALNTYNSNNSIPLSEPDGTPVAFNF